MLRTVVVAYDGSESAADALSLGIELVRCLQADMHIVAVVDAFKEASDADAEANRRHARQRLRDAENLASRVGLNVQLCVLEGEPVAQILHHARLVTADIIVMGHGLHGRLDQLTGASVGARVLEQSPCAVLMPRVPGFHTSRSNQGELSTER